MKINDQVSLQIQKTLDRCQEAKMDRPYFIGSSQLLPATAMGLTSKTAVNWCLKVKGIEYNVGLTKSYGITVSMQKFSLIHKIIQ